MTAFKLVSSRSLLLVLATAVAVVGIGSWWARADSHSQTHAAESAEQAPEAIAAIPSQGQPATTQIEFLPEDWKAAGIALKPAQVADFQQMVELTGTVGINEDRLAHIYPVVEGVVDEVRIHLGDRVKQGDVLAIIQSREVAKAKLTLYQDRLERDLTQVRDDWTQQVVANVLELIESIRGGTSIDEIEKHFRGRPIGEFRDQLLTAYISQHTHEKTVARLSPLTESGAVSGKQLIEARSRHDAARVTLQSLLEHIKQEAQQEGIRSAHAVKELQTRVSVDEAALKVLGFDGQSLEEIDPATQGEAISHLPIVAPFDGTILSKDVVLLERVGPQQQVLSIADLSTVWVTANIYEEHMPLLSHLDGETIHLKSDAWPEKTFPAQVFYTGDVVDPSTRTISLRAIAENSGRMLKPGMFVRVTLPAAAEQNSLQIPLSAIQSHEGRSFVFVHDGEGAFSIRDVQLGRRNDDWVEVTAGVESGEMVVSEGGFALKSRMLAGLLEE